MQSKQNFTYQIGEEFKDWIKGSFTKLSGNR